MNKSFLKFFVTQKEKKGGRSKEKSKLFSFFSVAAHGHKG